ncbi:unnamed protein product [Blepharisma stoltei]|uniref:chitin synthase n=1 Tax=Blepharisma stoltei TaxID=1481888 RepID=A0AAU9I8K1_9CILI|nr:unnamed protein product [Blepharisma stoltei]
MEKEKEYWYDYQPFLLNKTMGRRGSGETELWGLDSVNGFNLVAQDIEELGLLHKYKSHSPESIGCEVVIGIFIQPEQESHLAATMVSVVKNIKIFEEKDLSVLCVAIADGRKNLKAVYNNNLLGKAFGSNYYNEREIVDRFNLSQDKSEISLKHILGNQPQANGELAHMFMHKDWPQGDSKCRLDLIFCIKEQYSGKLNSHLWFFGGFCQHINPRIVMLLDAGIEPEENALFYMYMALRADENLAGCTGELKPNAKNCRKIFRYAQLFEYKTIYMLDKALESSFGYVSSLPSYFSAYQWKALSMNILLETHFKSICHPEEIDAANSNYYLSVDRLLSLSLFMQKDHRYTLRYVKRSKAKINVSNKIYKIMLTRRKWINGTWFILLESLKKSCMIFCCKTSHPWYRIVFFAMQMILYVTNFFFSWLIVGYFFVFLSQGLRKKAEDDDWNIHVQDILMIFYGLVLEYIMILSLGVAPRKANKCLTVLSWILLAISIISVFFFLSYWFQEPGGGYSQIYFGAFLISIGLFALNILFHLDILCSIPHYIAFIPVLVNICMIYSICNIHDCSNSDPEKITENERDQIVRFQPFRAFWLLIWILTNGIFAYLMYELIETKQIDVLMGIAMVGMINVIIRLIGGLCYHLKEWILNKFDNKVDLRKPNDEESENNNSAQIFINVQTLSEDSSLN